MSKKTAHERMTEIKAYLDGWCPSPDDYDLYELWENRKILPYGGGWLDQPARIHRLFNNCALWDEWLLLNNKLPSAEGAISFSDLART